MSDFEKGYFFCCVSYILRAKNRDSITFIQKALCAVILPRFNDFKRDYKNFKQFKKYNDIEDFLSFIFFIEKEKMLKILSALESFKNKQDSLSECLNFRF